MLAQEPRLNARSKRAKAQVALTQHFVREGIVEPRSGPLSSRRLMVYIEERYPAIFQEAHTVLTAGMTRTQKYYRVLVFTAAKLGLDLKPGVPAQVKDSWVPFPEGKPRPDPRVSGSFLESYEWKRVRMVALKKYGRRCMCCGATPEHGAVMNVDHIKPRKFFPELALDVNNLQILCHDCNHGKGNWDMTDWRPTDATAN